jgi:hypothetical protein
MIRGARVFAAMVCLGAGVSAAAPSTAPAAIEPYEARFVGQCCFMTIESGATEKQFFTLVNAGTETWGAPGTFSVNLAADEPHDRASPFQAASWPTDGRPVIGVSRQVHPGEAYKFVFDVKAPPVSTVTTYHEYFALVAEGYRWLDNTTGLGPLMWLDYTVVPAAPPVVSVQPSGQTITAGSPLGVVAHANGVASLNRVVLQFAGQTITDTVPRDPEIAPDEHSTWDASASFSTGGLSPGPQTVVATAYDDAGLSSTTTQTVSITAENPPPKPVIVGRPSILIGGRRSKITRLVASSLHSGETAYFRCRRCLGSSRLMTSPVVRGSETLHPHSLRIKRRSDLTVYVTSPGAYGRYKRYRFPRGRVGAATLAAEGCLAPGTLKDIACPS